MLPKRVSYQQQPIVLESIAVDKSGHQYIAQIVASTFLDETKPVIKFYQVVSDADADKPWAKRIGRYIVTGTPASYYLDTFMGYDMYKAWGAGTSDTLAIDSGQGWTISGINSFRDEIRQLERYGQVPKPINEGLMLSYKKFPDRYFDNYTGKEFSYEDINKHPLWYKWEFDNNGNRKYYEQSNGYWSKHEHNTDGNETYYENSDGYWEKTTYNQYGNLVYYENSSGIIIDKINQINEGLMLPYKKKHQPRYFDGLNGREFNERDIDEHSEWYKEQYNDNGKLIYREYSNGDWENFIYDNFKRLIYYEDSTGYWEKSYYNPDSNIRYIETSKGEIIDGQINEGLMLPKLPTANVTVKAELIIIYDMSDTEPEYTPQRSTEYTCDRDFQLFINEEMSKLQQIVLENENIKMKNINIKYCRLNDVDNAEAVVSFDFTFTAQLKEESTWGETVDRKIQTLKSKYNLDIGRRVILNIQPI